MLSRQICLLWHGIFSGRKYPIAFYTKKERVSLAREVAFAAKNYSKHGKPHLSDRLLRYLECIDCLIAAKNSSPKSNFKEKNIMPQFLRLLYSGKKPSAFWAHFRKKYHLPLRISPSAFWDHFEEFQPRRLDIAFYLAKNAKGRILDVCSGSHSYIRVDAALDSSAKALAKNKFAKKKIKFDINKKARLPFPDASFDTIMLNSALSYVSSPKRLLSECKRILRPGGVLLITNAPVNDCHPAKYFEKNKVDSKRLSTWLGNRWAKIKEDSVGETLLVRAIR